MSTYEEFMVILTVAILIVAILNSLRSLTQRKYPRILLKLETSLH